MNKIFQLPFALSMGPQRAGTSWIDKYLRYRKDVCLPRDVKETFFFDRYHEKGMEYYAGLFYPNDKHQILMEVSASYFDCRQAPGRIYNSVGPVIKLICPLRDPVERSYSLYKHYLRYGVVQGSLAQAAEQNPQIIESSFYERHLRNWGQYFDLGKITYLFQEELERDPQSFAKKLCDGLGVSFSGLDEQSTKVVNQATQSPSKTLAICAQAGGDWCRAKGLYWPINLAKQLGIKRAVFGREDETRQKTLIPEEDKLFLERRLSGEKDKLEALLGKKIEFWD